MIAEQDSLSHPEPATVAVPEEKKVEISAKKQAEENTLTPQGAETAKATAVKVEPTKNQSRLRVKVSRVTTNKSYPQLADRVTAQSSDDSQSQIESIRALATTALEAANRAHQFMNIARLSEMLGWALVIANRRERLDSDVVELIDALRHFIENDLDDRIASGSETQTVSKTLVASEPVQDQEMATRKVPWLRTRTRNAVANSGLETIGQLAECLKNNPRHFEDVKGVGNAAIKEIKRELEKRKLI